MKFNFFSITAVILFLVFLTESRTQTLYNGIGHIPQDHQQTWNVAGMLQNVSTITPVAVFVITGSTGDDDAELATAISNARNHVQVTNGLAIIYFLTGTYYLDIPISLNYGDRNIVFQGAGSDRTTLIFRNMTNIDCITISGIEGEPPGDPGNWLDLNQNFNKGTNRIHAASGTLSSIAVGKWIHFVVHNYDYRDNPIDETEIVGQISRVDNAGSDASGDWVDIKDEANMNYIDNDLEGRPMWVRKITPIQNIGIENMRIERSPYQKAYDAKHPYNISINYAVNCWIKGVESYKPSCHHVSITRSSHCEISGCYFHEAMDYHGGGWGYGVNLAVSTTNCLIENNIFRQLRHSLVAAGGSNCNVWTFNYSREQKYTFDGDPTDDPTDRDLDLHAKWPFGHLFEQNIIEEIGADNANGANGFYNTFVRNFCYDEDEITILDMEHWSFLGNLKDDFTDNKALTYSASHFPTLDLFGYTNNYSLSCTHLWNILYGYVCELADISYYYSSRPYFLTPDYSWPAVGPEQNLTQRIPAKDRYLYCDKKTYLLNPAPKPLSTSGTLIYDQIWSGTHTLTGTVTIPSRLFIEVRPGATITIPTGARLQVNGLLTAVGNSNSIITFDRSGASNTWYGIHVDSSGHAVLKFCHIKNASYGVYANQSAPEVKNCIFEDNYHAFYAYYGMQQNYGFENNQVLNSTALYDIHIDHPVSLMIANCEGYNGTSRGLRLDWANYSSSVIDNKFHGYGQRCVTLNYSTPIFLGNMMYDNVGHGLYIANDSDPELIFDDYPGENVMAYNGLNGVYISGNSYPIIGGVTNPGQEAASNCWYGNGTSNGYMDIQYLGTPMLDATYNWWGTANPANYRYLRNNNLDVSNGLIENPCPDPHSLPKKFVDERELIDANETNTITNSDKDAVQLFEKARQLQREKQYQGAIMIYQQIINDYPTSHEAEMACVRLMRCYQLSENKTEGKSTLGSIATRYTDSNVGMKAAEVLADQEVRDGNISTAITYYTNLSTTKNNRSNEALFELWKIYFNISRNKDQAQSLLALYENQYGLDENLLFMKLAMGLISGDEAAKLARELEEKLYKKQALTEIWEIPETFELHANHPNPFNPVTRIDYELPEAARVKIEIYNILGERITVLVNREMSAGRYFELWNARNSSGHRVSSGIYFCRMQTAQFTKTIKMTLLP